MVNIRKIRYTHDHTDDRGRHEEGGHPNEHEGPSAVLLGAHRATPHRKDDDDEPAQKS